MKLSEKGKYFTDKVSKRQVEVSIVTVYAHVRGHVFVLPNQRVKDLLNNGSEQFLAITGALFTTPDGQTQEAGFTALNKHYVISVVPLDEDYDKSHEEDEFYPY